DIEALSLASRDHLVQRAADAQISALIKTEVFKNFDHASVNFFIGKIRETELGVVVQVLIYRELLDQKVILQNISDDAVQSIGLLMQIQAVDSDFALLWFD